MLFAVAGAGAGLTALRPVEVPVVFILGGDTDGYLSPCGCTKPMAGGIRRRADAIRVLAATERRVVLENGGLVAGSGRQDTLKAETLAQTIAVMGVDAVNFTPSEARLGAGTALSLDSLAPGRFMTSSLLASPTNPFPLYARKEAFLIAGISAAPARLGAELRERTRSATAAALEAAQTAEDENLRLVVMLAGNRDTAVALARAVPSIALIQYRTAGDPPKELEFLGKTALASPGEKGKHIVRLEFAGGTFRNYLPVKLNPDFKDDPDAARIYDEYLSRVAAEKLLDKLPRKDGPEFAGSKACAPCHQEAHKIWTGTRHSTALDTLEREKHDRDPDCVSCHVVGLELKTGFRSRSETPELAHVGCESCHGPGKAHTLNPYGVKMGKVGEKSCAPCHVPEHSPNFVFQSYWKKIQHK